MGATGAERPDGNLGIGHNGSGYTFMYPIRYKITDGYDFLPHIASFSLMIVLMLLRDKAMYFGIGAAICRIMPVIHDAVLWIQELGWNNMGEFWQHS